MNHYYSDVIEFTGDHYEFGYMQGELLRKSPILSNRKKQWAHRRKRHFTIDEQKALSLFQTFIPQMIGELRGLADALGWTMKEALREFGGYYIEYERSGCSVLTGDHYLVRNYDSHPGFYEGRYMLFNPTDGGYATIGPSMQITGRTDGMNEKGLAMGYNFINRLGSADGFLCNMIGRMILETCATVEEAVALLEKVPHRTSFSYILTDKSGQSLVVETSPRRVEVRESNICTNHFEVLTEENRYRMDDSLRRYEVLENKQNTLTVYEAYQLLNGEEQGVFSEQYDASAGTIHTAAYLPQEGKALFAIGGNRKPVIFDMNRLIVGDQTNIKKLKGILNFAVPFVNMAKIKDDHAHF